MVLSGCVWYRVVVCGFEWLCVVSSGCVWFRVVVCVPNGCVWYRVVVCGSKWLHVVPSGCVWFRVGGNKNVWMCVNMCGCGLTSVDVG